MTVGFGMVIKIRMDMVKLFYLVHIIKYID